MCLDDFQKEDKTGGKTKMVQADQKPVIWTVVIAAIALLVAGLIGFSNFSSNIGNKLDVMNTKLGGLDIDEQAIANAIVAGITLPEWEVPDINTESSDRLCELTEGCEYWEGDIGDLSSIDVEDAEEDYFEVLSEMLEVDEDDEFVTLVLENVTSVRDYQIRAYTENENDAADNWEIKVFIRQEYEIEDTDVDSEDWDYGVLYLVITSTLDEGEYDSMVVEEVSRTFEF